MLVWVQGRTVGFSPSKNVVGALHVLDDLSVCRQVQRCVEMHEFLSVAALRTVLAV